MGAHSMRSQTVKKSRTLQGAMQSWAAASLLIMGFVSGGLAGCASHSDHTKAARSALDAGNAQKALELSERSIR